MDDPRLVCWHSFEPGVATFGLDGVITGLGLAVFGADFARLEAPQRLDAVKELLAEYRAVLVWDNFESVREMPDPTGATLPLDTAGRAQLREFLQWIRDQSPSAVIITSRAREGWLGEVRRVPVGGLNRVEAAEYAGYLLAPFPAARERRERRSFGELLDWLDGHPLAMRLTLPRLDAAEAALAARDTGQRPDRYLDPVLLAGLIVAIASLAWTTYNDRRKQTPDPEPEAIARQVRITLREQDTVLPPGAERITEVVVTEITRQASPPE